MVSNLLDMRLYIPRKTNFIKPKDRPWFNKSCTDAVRSKEEVFIERTSNLTPENQVLCKEARNRCNHIKALLKQQQFLHEKKFRLKVLDYIMGSKNFWSFVTMVKNAETSSIPHLINDGQTFTHSVENKNKSFLDQMVFRLEL